MVQPAQLVIPTATSFEITSKYTQFHYIAEATHQEKIETHSPLPQQSRSGNKGEISKHDQHNQ